jgi:hypothetical protein
MTLLRSRRIAPILAGLLTAVATLAVEAYSTNYKWATTPVVFYLNPANRDVSQAAAETAVQEALTVWSTEPGSSFRYSYGGRVKDTSTGLDGRNVLLFRNATSPSGSGVIATTYSWISSGNRIDSDIVFWDESWAFFTGTSGCSRGAYIEDIATHELGHALGLGHSSNAEATMYPKYTRCSQALRTLDADDIAGVRALYGTSSGSKNTAPAVSILAPLTGTSAPEGTSIVFSGTAMDGEDGSLTDRLKWTSSRDGTIGAGGTFSRTLSAGTHTITASVIDSGGLSGSAQISVTITAVAKTTESSAIQLLASGYKVKGVQMADLSWIGLTSLRVDVYRDGVRVARVSNTGRYTDNINMRGGGAYTYRVCAEGTSTCTNDAIVRF